MKPIRFLLTWPEASAGNIERIALSTGSTFRVSGLDGPRLWAEHEEHVLDAGERGVVIGYLFERTTGRRVTRLPREILQCPDASSFATWLTREYWGAYAALLIDGPHLCVYPDPSGLLPVFRSKTAEGQACTSDATLLHMHSLTKARVSWSDLSSHLQRPDWRGQRTCLTGIEEVPAGHMTSWTKDGATSVAVWHATQFMPDKKTRPFDELAFELRATAQSVMRAWGSVSSRLLVSASGGVDSSLIAAALATTGKDFACLTIATGDPSGDERVPVRMLANALGVETIEARYDPRMVDLTVPVSLGFARPSGKAFMQEVRRQAIEAAGQFGASAVFDGNGGDNLFCYLHSPAPILDRWRSEGLSRGTAATYLDICRIAQTTLPAMARALALRARRGARPAAWTADRRLLASDVPACDAPAAIQDMALAVPFKHPGKVEHLALMLRTQNFIHSAGGPADLLQFSPLMSQPLVELCLSIPTWIWCQGGINRALARAAFSQELPAAIVRRVSKAGPDSVMRVIFAQNRALIRDMLLGGLLRANGLIDAVAIEQAIASDPHGEDPIIYRLLDFVEAEAWARSWQP
ncbi:asparagine synthase [Novosphingobium subterraneum]|uniref:asparagine synthase (glutamine-hydrolyzing) n=1 Tax=Novosphingobium subterraneum TaxID=48936 RepID=A0A0B8ZG79_9SPHN|nr:asparagine synthase [Novosphingobium subterraneum]